MKNPLLSFIVLSYNYERYIKLALESIFRQSVSDLEIVVVDDCSTDRSREIIRSFADPRVRLIENERNLGGAGSYNKAVMAARGTWLVNLDADDWIADDKSDAQLEVVLKNSRIDIIGSWVNIVDAEGNRHPEAEQIEKTLNQPLRLNLVETWLGQNPLCRSSTMVRREAHMRIGLDDEGMVRAPDYELWTRALARGCHFELLHEKKTFMRQHRGGVTRGDPVGTLLELAYAMVVNLAPLAECRSLFDLHAEMVRWVATNSNILSLKPAEALRLIAAMQILGHYDDFTSFRNSLVRDGESSSDERLGRQALMSALNYVPLGTLEKLNVDISLYIEAREYWKDEAEYWKDEASRHLAEAARLHSLGGVGRFLGLAERRLRRIISREPSKP